MKTEDSLLLTAASEGVEEIEECLILSNLTITKGSPGISITKTEDAKCERCWRHREEVGSHVEHPTLCGRCTEAVESLGNKESSTVAG